MPVFMPVIGYEDCYSISDEGALVRTSLTRKRQCKIWRPVTPRYERDGYVRYRLSKDKVPIFRTAHRLAWEAFNGPIPEGMEINHLNGVRSDNRLSNLEVCTRSENLRHSFKYLNRPSPNNPSYGSKNGCAKLTEEKVRTILRLYQTGKYRQKDLGAKFGVSQRAISLITRREKWQHVDF